MSPCQATALITAGALSALAQSKLAGTPSALAGNAKRPAMMRRTSAAPASRRSGLLVMQDDLAVLAQVLRAGRFAHAAAILVEIGRASCRERVCQNVWGSGCTRYIIKKN